MIESISGTTGSSLVRDPYPDPAKPADPAELSTGDHTFTASATIHKAGRHSRGLGPVSKTVKVVGVQKIIVNNSDPEDEGPAYTAVDLSIELRAKPNPANTSFPSGKPIWSIDEKPNGSNLADPADGNATVEIKPDVAGKYVIRAACGTSNDTIELNAILAEIKRDGQSLTDDLRKVLPGQKMNLEVSLTPPSGTTVTGYKWSLAGNTFKDYTANDSTGTLTSLAAGDLDDQMVNYYWTNGGGSRSVTCTVTLSNGKKVYVKDKFNVEQPTVTFTTTLGTAKINAAGNQIGLYADADSDNGIVFTGKVEMPAEFNSERWHWIQLVTPQRTQTLDDEDSTEQAFSLNGMQVLDTKYPYAPQLLGSYATGTTSESNSDSPESPLWASMKKKAVNDETFIMTLMFLPPGSDSRWVPTKSVTWKWKISATKGAGGTWTEDPGASQSVTPVADTTTHPIWTNNVANGS